jgi:hypothetical protein
MHFGSCLPAHKVDLVQTSVHNTTSVKFFSGTKKLLCQIVFPDMVTVHLALDSQQDTVYVCSDSPLSVWPMQQLRERC